MCCLVANLLAILIYMKVHCIAKLQLWYCKRFVITNTLNRQLVILFPLTATQAMLAIWVLPVKEVPPSLENMVLKTNITVQYLRLPQKIMREAI